MTALLPLADSHGRIATDLRVSLTDRCNLRCAYCMPAEGLDWLPRESHLSDDEMIRLIGIAVTRLGVRKIRLSGGEPLLRAGTVGIIKAIAPLGVPISLTTNGIQLAKFAPALKQAGLDRVNVSLDTLVPERFTTITRRRGHDDVIAGLAAAAACGLDPIKVNAVLLRGINDDETGDLLAFCIERGYELRFIEQMPLDPMHAWDRAQMVTAAEIHAALSTRWRLTADQHDRAGAPAETWIVNGGPTRVGIVGSITRPFCADCTRTRLTADGQIRSCLFATEEFDLRSLLRSGASDEELATAWQSAMAGKALGHGVNDDGFRQPSRPMSAIGG